MYFIYILECADGTYYIGYTTNIPRRLDAHNRLKSGAKYTKMRRPVKLVYSEAFPSLSQALKREHALKKLTRQQKDLFLTSQIEGRIIS